jgi:dTDP-4-dehydrorhamnose reductase
MSEPQPLLITGASGFVGASILAQAGPAWTCHGIARHIPQGAPAGVQWHAMDVCDPEALRAVFEQVRPAAVIHAAAIADIDYCEAHPMEATRINEDATRDVATLCAEFGARLVHCSTDTVFDGARGRYTEGDPPSPINHYASTKVAAENVVHVTLNNYVIARIALVMGLPLLGKGNAFLAKTIAALEAGETAGFPESETRSPIDVITLGAALLELAAHPYRGLLHLAGDTICTRLEMGRRIAAHLGYPVEQIVCKEAADMPGRAPRPRDVSLLNARAHTVLKTRFCALEEGLDRIRAAQEGQFHGIARD